MSSFTVFTFCRNFSATFQFRTGPIQTMRILKQLNPSLRYLSPSLQYFNPSLPFFNTNLRYFNPSLRYFSSGLHPPLRSLDPMGGLSLQFFLRPPRRCRLFSLFYKELAFPYQATQPAAGYIRLPLGMKVVPRVEVGPGGKF
jgi:hypothetical protein